MRDLFKKSVLWAILPAIVFGTGLPLIVSVPIANATSCAQWTLLDASSTPMTSFSPYQISLGDPGFDPQNPPVSLASGGTWQCTTPGAAPGVLTTQDTQLAQGTTACQKAVSLSAKFGGFTALDPSFSSNIQKGVLDNITNFLKSKASSEAGINLDYKDIASKGISAAGNLLQSYTDQMFVNPLKQTVSNQSQALINGAKQEMAKITQQYLGSIATGITNILGTQSSVPVQDQTVAQKIDVTNQNINNMIAEQKRNQLIQDTRDRCNDSGL